MILGNKKMEAPPPLIQFVSGVGVSQAKRTYSVTGVRNVCACTRYEYIILFGPCYRTHTVYSPHGHTYIYGTFYTKISLHTCISITDKAKINEQNKSIAVGPFYMGTYFEPIWTLLPEDVAVLNPTGYRTLKRRYPTCVRHQNGFSHIVMVWYVVLKIET